MRWALGFSVLAIVLGRFFGFGVCCGFPFFSLFRIWFSVATKIQAVFVFSDFLVSDAVFGFHQYLVFGFSASTVSLLLRGMRDKPQLLRW